MYALRAMSRPSQQGTIRYVAYLYFETNRRRSPLYFVKQVVYNPAHSSNETIVYTDDAIRPVFLIIF
jgi:hypothetical protein